VASFRRELKRRNSGCLLTGPACSRKAVIAGSAAIIGTLIGVIYLDMRGDIDSIRSSTSETAKTLSVLTTRVETGFAELSGKLDVTNTKLDNLQRQ
jgi:hypothetical protein